MNRLVWLVGLLAPVSSVACGSDASECADCAQSDAGASADSRVDVIPDARAPDAETPAFTQLTSAEDFPTPSMAITDFDAGELTAAGVTATGFNSGSGLLLVGNPAAPIATPFVFPSATGSTFVFATPVTAAGFSITDAAFGIDDNVVVTLSALGSGDQAVGSIEVTVLPANTGEEESANAMFVGFESPTAITTLNISWDITGNSMVLDNLLYK